jgi:replication-associated recombination protein RarA
MALEYFGNEEAISRTNHFLQNFGKPNSKKGIIYAGAPGVGKTHLTNYIAEQRKANLIVVNASDKRTKDKVQV